MLLLLHFSPFASSAGVCKLFFKKLYSSTVEAEHTVIIVYCGDDRMLIINPYLLQLHLVNMCFFNDILVLGFQIGIFYPAVCLVIFWLIVISTN